MVKHLFACDPGKTGAIAYFHDGRLVWVGDMPLTGEKKAPKKDRDVNARAIHSFLSWPSSSTFVIELPLYLGVNGAGSVGTTGEGWGKVVAAAEIAGCEIVTVRPAAWKKALGLTGKDKNESRFMAQGLWKVDDFDRGIDHGRAEACLIGHWYLTKVDNHGE